MNISTASETHTEDAEDYTTEAPDNFRNRDYWIVENALYKEPSFRLKKCAQVINEMSAGRECSLLDVGCGPAALRPLLSPNVSYYGIDIAIHEPAPYLQEIDTHQKAISFNGNRFDFVAALGFFEYMGDQQTRKFEEIRSILKDDGKFMMSYINFSHFRRRVWPNYNNVQSISDMRKALNEVFRVEKCFPASHHWRQKQPGERSLQGLQMYINFNIPIFSPMMAVEYFFVCAPRR